jgi:hypothetical protein
MFDVTNVNPSGASMLGKKFHRGAVEDQLLTVNVVLGEEEGILD